MPCPKPRGGNETARAHHASLRRSGVAARRPSAAARTYAAHRRADGLCRLDLVSRGPNILPWVAPVHQRSGHAYDGGLDFFHSGQIWHYLPRSLVIAVFSRIRSRPRPRWKVCKLAAQAMVRQPRKPERALLLSG